MQTLAALLFATALWLVPGLAVMRLVLPHVSTARSLVAAPAVSAGILYGCGQVLTLLDLPVDRRLGIVALLVSAAAAPLSRRHGSAAPTVGLPRSVALCAAAGSAISAALWITSVGSIDSVPPHDDGYNHGFMVTRVLEVGSLAPDALFLAGPVEGPAAAFYPLALHQQAAMVVESTGVDVALALTLVTLVPVVVGLPLGMALLCRRLLPDHLVVAAAAPLLVAVQPVLMYSMSWWGGLTMAVGLALFPGFLDVLLDVTQRVRVHAAVVAAVGLVGFAGLHTSEVPLLALVATTLVVAGAAGPLSLRDVVRRTAVLALPFVLALLLLVPVLLQMAGVYEQTMTNAPGRIGAVSPLEALGRVLLLQVGHPPAAPLPMAVAAWVGLVLVGVKGGRAARAWVGLCLVVAVLCLWLWAWPGPVINVLTSFWYSSAPRVTYILVLLVMPLVAAGLVLPVQGWLRAVRTEREHRPGLGSTAAASSVIALGAIFVGTSVPATSQGVRENYREYSLAGSDERAAFRFLSQRVGPQDRVLNQIQDGSPWMYSLEGVQPLITGKSDTYGTPQWAGIRQLLADAGLADRDAGVAQLLREHQVRFVYVNERVFPGRRAELQLEALQRSPAFRQVFHSGAAHVFAVETGRLAATDS